MSTNYTPNYQLSLWEASDQVVRTDFNADNAKIDAVLAHAEWRVIKELVMEEAEAANHRFSLDGIDWGAYSVICVDAQPLVTQNNSSVGIEFEGIQLGTLTSASSEATDAFGTALIFMLPMFRPERRVVAAACGLSSTGKESYIFHFSFNYENHYLTMNARANSANNMLLAGSKVTVWGKK